MAKKPILSWFITFPVLLTHFIAHADFVLHSWENQHQAGSHSQIQLSNQYYQTSKNYDPIGIPIPIGNTASFNTYTRNQTDLSYAIAITDRLSFFSRFAFASVFLSGTPITGSRLGPSDQTLALNYQILKRSPHALPAIELDLQVQGDFPLYAATGPSLGDSSTDFSFGLFCTGPTYDLPSGTLKIQTGFGLTQRTLLFSTALPWSMGAFYTPHQSGFIANLSAVGILSLRTDSNWTRSSDASNGSQITNGVNSSLATVRAQAGYQWQNHSQLLLSIHPSFWGQNAPNGVSVGVWFTLPLAREPAPPLTQDVTQKPMNSAEPQTENSPTARVHAKIIKANDRLHLVKIDKGTEDGVDLGQIFDIFIGDGNDHQGEQSEPIARGMVTHTKPTEAAIEVREYFKDYWIDEGFVAQQSSPPG